MENKRPTIKAWIISVLIVCTMIVAFYYGQTPTPTIEILSQEWNIWTATWYVLVYKTQNATEVIINGKPHDTGGSINYSLGWGLWNSMRLSIIVKNGVQSYNKEVTITRDKTQKEINMESKEQEKLRGEQKKIVKEQEVSSSFEDSVLSIVKTYWTFEVTIMTTNGRFAASYSKPPFVIIINTTSSDISSCFDAKDKLFSIMKALYTSSETKSKISRIRFSAFGYLQASLGSSDLGFSWSDSWPSNLFRTLLKYKSYEDESGPMNTRTRAKSVGNCE